MLDLEWIYRRTLDKCSPDEIVREFVRPDMPRVVVAIGKCGGGLLDGVASVIPVERAFVAIPRGYPGPHWHRDVTVLRGGHPSIDSSSFDAGARLLDFISRAGDVLFLISGGGSACVELPQPPFTRSEVTDVNARLVASALPIEEINIVRKHLSAIKGGRLASRLTGNSVTLVYSDVSTDQPAAVASGPTLPDPTSNAEAAGILERLGGCDRIVAKLRDESLADTVKRISKSSSTVIADNSTLTTAAARIASNSGLEPLLWPEQIESDVEEAARSLAERAVNLKAGQILVAGGEPTVLRRGSGTGGRCSELALRFARALPAEVRPRISALFGSSDGVDGSSGAAGIVLDPLHEFIDEPAIERALEASDSFRVATALGRPIMIPPTGNNLRDLFLISADSRPMAHH